MKHNATVKCAGASDTSCARLQRLPVLAMISVLVLVTGCNSFGNAKLVQELRSENERLLAEFRAERDRREEAERTQKLMETRLAESEKLLARSYNAPGPSRLSSLPQYDQPTSSGFPGNDSRPSSIPGALDGGSGLRWQGRGSP